MNMRNRIHGVSAARLLVVNVAVLVGVSVQVAVQGSARVRVNVLVGPVAYRPVDAPHEVREPERHEQPGGDVSAHGLYRLQLEERDADDDADKTEHDGTQHVPRPAERRNESGLAGAPPARLRQHDERNVVVRSQSSVDESYRRCRPKHEEKSAVHIFRLPPVSRSPRARDSECVLINVVAPGPRASTARTRRAILQRKALERKRLRRLFPTSGTTTFADAAVPSWRTALAK